MTEKLSLQQHTKEVIPHLLISWLNSLNLCNIFMQIKLVQLNFNVHPAKQLLPNGIAVDYIFTSSEFKVHDFRVITTPDLSYHYGLALDVEV